MNRRLIFKTIQLGNQDLIDPIKRQQRTKAISSITFLSAVSSR